MNSKFQVKLKIILFIDLCAIIMAYSTPIQNGNEHSELNNVETIQSAIGDPLNATKCPYNFTWKDYTCVSISVNCPINTQWNGQVCTPPPIIQLPLQQDVHVYDNENCSEIHCNHKLETAGSEQFHHHRYVIQTPPIPQQQNYTIYNQLHRLYFPRPRQTFAIDQKIYNPQPTCSSGYEWNGENCVQTISLNANCPENYTLNDGRCVHKTDGTCPIGFDMINSVCVGDVEHQTECPQSYEWNGEYCVHTMDACPPGYNLTNLMCQRAIVGFCPIGTFMKDNKCVQQNVQNVQCADGYTWTGQECVQYSNVCENGYRLVANKCEKIVVSDEVPLLVCSNGFELKNGECVSTTFECPDGFQLDAERMHCIENTPRCPNGYEYNAADSVCQQTNEAITQAVLKPMCPDAFTIHGYYCHHSHNKNVVTEPICPNGYLMLNNTCVVFNENFIVNNTVTTFTTPICPPLYEFFNNSCFINRTNALPVSPICPPGYYLSNNMCILLLESVAPMCPIHYVFDDARNLCILNTNTTQLQTAPQFCPDDYFLSHNLCIKHQQQRIVDENVTKCSPHYRFNGTICVRVGTTGTDIPVEPIDLENPVTEPTPAAATTPSILLPCPNGYELFNGTCNIIQPICPNGFTYYNRACYRIYNLTQGNNNIWPTQPQSHPINNADTGAGEIVLEFSITNTINNNNTIYAPINVHVPNRNLIQVQASKGNNDNGDTGNGNDNSNNIHRMTNIILPIQNHSTKLNNGNVLDINNKNEDEENGIISEQHEKCCEILSPRHCKQAIDSDEWICYHQNNHICSYEYCTQPKIFLKARRVQYSNSVLTMPPPPRRWFKLINFRSIDLNGVSKYSICSQ